MIKTIQGLRAVFMGLIILSHILIRFDIGGEGGVAFFFILSGFILSFNYNRRNTEPNRKSLIVKQLCKIYPLHIITLFMMLAINSYEQATPSWDKTLITILMLQSWVPSNEYQFILNGSSWFLSSIVLCYFAFTYLYHYLLNTSLRQIMILCAIVMTVYIPLICLIQPQFVNCFIYVFPPLRLIDFSLGILLYRLYRSEWFNRKYNHYFSNIRRYMMVECGLVIVLVVMSHIYYTLPLSFREVSYYWLALSFVIIWFSKVEQNRTYIDKILTSRILISIGNLSFEWFITHWVAIKLIAYTIRHTIGQAPTYQVLLCYFFGSLLVAYIVRKWFSIPMNRYLTQKLSYIMS